MKDHFIQIKEVPIKNNCPICYNNDGLFLTFKQRIIHTDLYKHITSEISHDLKCKTCNSAIYPVQWTDEFEQVFEYHKKALTPYKSSVKLKRASWILLTALLLVIVSILTLTIYHRL